MPSNLQLIAAERRLELRAAQLMQEIAAAREPAEDGERGGVTDR